MRTIQSLRCLGDAPDTIGYDFIDERKHRQRIFYEGVPHILQYGFSLPCEEKTEWETKAGLWRSGKKFEISVRSENIRGSKFYELWRPMIENKWNGDKLKGEDREAHKLMLNDRRAQLFDLIIHPCLPLIRSLAPVEPHWKTLQDFLHCRNYELQLFANVGADQPNVVQTAALQDYTSVYDYCPKSSERLGEIPSGVPQYSPQDIVIDAFHSDGDIFRNHNRVRLQDGTSCFFVSGEADTHYIDTDEFCDESLNTIRAFFRVHRASQRGWLYPAGLPKLLGIVMDPFARSDHWRPETEEVIAGILLTWIPEAKPLKDVQNPSLREQKVWRQRVFDIVTALHSQGIAVGGPHSCFDDDTVGLLNSYTVLIDSQQEAWIWMSDPVFANAFADPVFAEYVKDPENANLVYDMRSFEHAVEMDLKAVRAMFPRGDESMVESRL